jgi:MFS family permease
MTEIQSVDSIEEGKLEFRIALPLFMVVMIDAFSVTVILPLLPYYATAFGMDIVGLGVLLATSPVLETLSWPIYNTFSKKLGRRPVLIASQLGTFVGFLILGAASAVWMLFLARVIDGIASGNNSVGRKLVRDTLTPDTRTHGLGMIEAAYSLGFLAGPLVGLLTLALTNDDYRMIPYVAAAISLLAVILSVILAQETLPPESRKSSGLSLKEKIVAKVAPLRKPVIIFLLAIFFLVQFSYIGFIEFYGLLALNRLGMNALTTVGIWLLGGVLAFLVNGVIVGRLNRQYNNRWLVLVGLGMLGAGLIFVSMTPEVPVVWFSRSEIIEELSFVASAPDDISIVPEFMVDLPPEGAAGWLGFGWFLISLFLIMVGGSMSIPAIKSLLLGNVEGYGASGVLTVSSILYKSAFIIVPLLLGFSIWKFGFTAPFLVEGLILILFLVFAFRWLESKA